MADNNENTNSAAAPVKLATSDESAAADLSKKDHVEEESAKPEFGWKQKGRPTVLQGGAQGVVRGGAGLPR
ncbi:hypothetical protein FIBSPDRAFT_879221 [Athelia psychrophila]|uniref:Uncharacterized protein n=1 Tax=Athelia psychrophila TaxID=1759441 RepID=A0A167U8T2_9AGAM|nr:hypothetical protein FIBSPDRAFT_879221 [Fibularhizoctonia sp. CBS 109695]